MLKSAVTNFYPKMHLTCTFLRNLSSRINGNIKANTKSPGKENKGATNLFWVAVALLAHVVRSYPHTQLSRLPHLYSLLERAGQQDRPITSRAFIPWSPHLILSHLISSHLSSHLSLAVPARDKTTKHYYYANNTK